MITKIVEQSDPSELEGIQLVRFSNIVLIPVITVTKVHHQTLQR